MRLFGARPRYGVLWKYGMFYATAPGYAFQRNEYLCIALAPLAALSVFAVLAMPLLSGSYALWLVVLGATANAAGAIGDLWIAAIVFTRYPPHAFVIDERDGMRIFLPENPAGAAR
jgi:hypothetical protein